MLTQEMRVRPLRPELYRKACSKCGLTKPLEQFYRSVKNKDGRQSWCKKCAKAERGAHYRRNPERERRNKRAAKSALLKWYVEFKSGKACTVCGGHFHHTALHWHHRDRAEKTASVGDLLADGCSRSLIALEIEKCDLVCANCHALITWEEAQAFSSPVER